MASINGVEFRLPDARYETIAWVHNEHMPGSATPLEISLRAARERTRPDGLPDALFINGYGFGRDHATTGGVGPFDPAIVAGWHKARMPAVEAVREEFEAFDPASVAPGNWREVLAGQEERFWAAFGGVHHDTMGQVLPAAARWLELYIQRFGASRRDDALALLAGFPNESGARAAALWALGRIAAREVDVRTAVEASVLPSGGSPAAAAFRVAFEALLGRFGVTTIMHLVDLPTWREDHAVPLAMIAAMARSERAGDPCAAEARAVERRVRLEAELARLEAAGDDALPALREVQAVAQHLASASEDHNLLCDQRLIAASRVRWLRIGTLLVGDALQSAHDVFYLTAEELSDALEQVSVVPRGLIAMRRAQQARWRAVSPPARLGAGSVLAAGHGTLRGTAGSAGIYRGRARVMNSLEDAGSLQAGDVLVCPATAPEWTPYFSVIGALISGSGGVLTHAAVVAREFGIPAVVGAAGAMSAIPDGAFVTVDGSRGLITIER